MTDAELIARLRSNIFGTGTTMQAADRIEALTAKLAKALAVMEESEIMLRLRGQAYMADAIAATLAEIKEGGL